MRVAWNRGRSYVFNKCTVYANKGSWGAALIRLYSNRCMRCGWNEATCDAHHIVPKSAGGQFTLDNGILLCPNCHRLARVSVAVREELPALKAAAVCVGERY